MPLTIPATGKSTVFNLMKQRVKIYRMTAAGSFNNFRNINIKEALDLKLFDGTINIQFTKEQELPALIE